MPARAKAGIAWVGALTGVNALAVLVRVLDLGRASLWFDEAFGLLQSQRPISEILTQPACCHPPMYGALLHYWGLLGRSEAFLRLPGALLGALGCAGLYMLVARWNGTLAGFLAGGLVALGSMIVFHAREVNPYGLSLLVSVGLLWVFDEALRRLSLGRLAALGAMCFIALFSHYGHAILLAALDLALLGWAIERILTERVRARDVVRHAGAIAAVQLPALTAFLLFFARVVRPQLERVMAAGISADAAANPVLEFASQTARLTGYLFIGPDAAGWAYIALGIVLGLGAILLLTRRENRWQGVALCSTLAIGFVLQTLGMYAYPDRHTLFAAPLMALALAGVGGWLVARATKRAGLRLAVGLVLGLGMLSLAFRLPFPLRAGGPGPAEELRPVLACVAARYQAGDGMYVYYGAKPAFTYYNEETRWPAVMGRWFRGEPAADQAQELMAALGAGRSWIVFSHALGGEDRAILSIIGGSTVTLARCQAPGAHAELIKFGAAE
jgi:hypothetical protein